MRLGDFWNGNIFVLLSGACGDVLVRGCLRGCACILSVVRGKNYIRSTCTPDMHSRSDRLVGDQGLCVDTAAAPSAVTVY